MKVIALSAFCVDYYPEQGISKPGGNSLNFAVHAKDLETDEVAVAGYLGEDNEAEKIIKLFKQKAINTDLLYSKQGKTASNKLYNTPDGERYSKEGEWNDGVFNHFHFSESDYSRIFEYDLIAIPFTDKNLLRIIKRNISGKNIVVDFLHFDDADTISPILPYIEIAFVSARLENLNNLKELADKQNKLIVATLGEEGSYAYYAGKKYFQPAIEVSRIVDTTGCGDAYQAAFSLNYLRDKNIDKAMLKAAQVASKVLSHYGGVG